MVLVFFWILGLIDYCWWWRWFNCGWYLYGYYGVVGSGKFLVGYGYYFVGFGFFCYSRIIVLVMVKSGCF